jgi:hypothetical protein
MNSQDMMERISKVDKSKREKYFVWNVERIKEKNLSIWGPEQLSRYSDSLRAGRSGGQIPVGARFSASVQTGPGSHPASSTTGTGSFPGVKRPGRGVDHPTAFSSKVKERVELYLYSPPGPSWPLLGWTWPFTLYLSLYFFKQFSL